VLIVIGAAQLFRRSKATSTIDQVVAKADTHFTVWAFGPPRDHESGILPSKAGRRSRFAVSADDLSSFRLQLVFPVHGFVGEHERGLVAKRRVAVLDLPDAALHRISAGTERAGLAIQDPFA